MNEITCLLMLLVEKMLIMRGNVNIHMLLRLKEIECLSDVILWLLVISVKLA